MNKYIKLVFAVFILSLGVYFFITDEIGWGIFCLLLSAIVIFLFFRNEFLLITFYHLQKQNIKAAEKWLRYIKNPKVQLIKSQEAYFYYMKGLLLAQKQEKGTLKESENLLKKALDIGLKQKHDIAAAKLNLSMAAMAKGKKRQAEALLTEAKKYDKAGLLTDQIKLMREQMKRVNIGRNLHNPMIRSRKKIQ